uniref:Uncharacterized protein n=1 Tax=Myoviridae sp. ctpvf97 TaxID=2825176 RepID=A0A8S5TW22_9CAUD|nr:MAG TPA: hypothetical protein [Myoviridae sp. ctpvf97]
MPPPGCLGKTQAAYDGCEKCEGWFLCAGVFDFNKLRKFRGTDCRVASLLAMTDGGGKMS